MSLNTLFASIGVGFIYNKVATYMNNMIFETAAINDKITVFDSYFMCPIASATIMDNLDISTESKWTMLNGNPSYKIWCFPTIYILPEKTIIYNIDDHARANKLFMKADIRIVN